MFCQDIRMWIKYFMLPQGKVTKRTWNSSQTTHVRFYGTHRSFCHYLHSFVEVFHLLYFSSIPSPYLSLSLSLSPYLYVYLSKSFSNRNSNVYMVAKFLPKLSSWSLVFSVWVGVEGGSFIAMWVMSHGQAVSYFSMKWI